MKSRNMKAIFASVLTVALLATAMTSFAAGATVTTTTTYNTGTDKVEVTTNVTGATPDSEVTYLVKSGDDTIYINQDTAVDGAVRFDYKIAKGKIADYQTEVNFGTNAGDTFAGDVADLGIVGLADVETDTYTITYVEDAAGNGDVVTANIAAVDGYEITGVSVNDESKGVVNSVQVGKDDVITVTTAAVEVEASIQVVKNLEGTTFTAVIIPTGNIAEFGVEYNGESYPSLEADKTKIAAVRLVLPEGTEVTEDSFGTYFVEAE